MDTAHAEQGDTVESSDDRAALGSEERHMPRAPDELASPRLEARGEGGGEDAPELELADSDTPCVRAAACPHALSVAFGYFATKELNVILLSLSGDLLV